MKKQLFVLAAVAFTAGTVLFTSCKKEDTTAPVITITGGNSMSQSLPSTSGAGTFTAPAATASDDEDGDISTSITVDATAVNPNLKGSYTVTYTVADAAGNTATATLTVDIVNDAEYLAGNYNVKDSLYNPLPPIVGNYTDVITADNSVNGKIWVTKFGNYVNGVVYMTISGTNVDVPSQTVNCGNPSNTRTFTNSAAFPSHGGIVTGTGAAGTTIVIDYKETVLSPASTANDIETYVKQ